MIISLFALFSVASSASQISYICNYATYSDENGNYKVTKEFVLIFFVDSDNGKGYVIGNQGSEEIEIITQQMGGVAFIEVAGTGNVVTTAIDAYSNSVHGRNT